MIKTLYHDLTYSEFEKVNVEVQRGDFYRQYLKNQGDVIGIPDKVN